MRNTDQLSWRSPLAIFSLLLAVAIFIVGINFMTHPHAGAAGYGVQVTSIDADTFLKAKGLRDVASGLALFCLVAFAPARTVALFILTMTAIPFGDAILVAMTGSAPAYAVPMHAITGLLMLVLSVLVLHRSSYPPANAVAK